MIKAPCLQCGEAPYPGTDKYRMEQHVLSMFCSEECEQKYLEKAKLLNVPDDK